MTVAFQIKVITLMGPEGPFPCLQEPANVPCPESDDSNPHSQHSVYSRAILILLAHLVSLLHVF